jgi:hypothetical protein
VHPGAIRICDGKDNNCDGRVDFASDVDNDGDGYPICAGDCNDSSTNANPGIIEGPPSDALMWLIKVEFPTALVLVATAAQEQTRKTGRICFYLWIRALTQ